MSADSTESDYKFFPEIFDGSGMSAVNYVFHTYRAKKIPGDFMLKLMEIIWPEFRIVDDTIFVAPFFETERYAEMVKEGHPLPEIQYWMNFFIVSDFFCDLSYEDAARIAEAVAGCWNAKLLTQFPQSECRAQIVYDTQYDEIRMTLCRLGLPL